MAILCLSTSMADLERRLGQIVIGQTRDRKPVLASALKAPGAMTVLLKDALMPNLVQTLENNPALVHGGPFANIAHGCNSVMATKAALKLADFVVTEAGFGADLGAEKFFDIKCRKAGLKPAAAVIVATVRALKMHGGVAKDALKSEDVAALKKGLANLGRHIQNVKKFGVPVAVAINHFVSDTDAEVAAIQEYCTGHGVEAYRCMHWAEGGKGTEDLAAAVAKLAHSGQSQFSPLYEEDLPLWDKIKTIATEIYAADDIVADQSVRDQIKGFETQGYGHFPICMAKTQYSFTTDPDRKGAPSNHVVSIREVRLSAGAEFIIAICGDIMTMPGLPAVPAAHAISVTDEGRITGLS
jgi:formate--tetrahydrofolate ligase